jgi:cellulose synthase/poly-beta-1,6-N-acetylglucosamine synthase-like glycosyltransferase
MSTLISLVGTAASGLAAALGLVMWVPSGVLLSQVSLAQRARRAKDLPKATPTGEARPRVAVLIPAHNEALGIAATLRSIRPQMRGQDRVLVVADNCQDTTAKVAAAEGAEVVERQHATLRGKGYALDFGLRHLAADAPDIVIIVDADCRVDPGCIDALARETQALQRPTQALYLMHAQPDATARGRLAAFAWLLRNQVRPWGSQHVGWPCQLMGSGMGFPYSQLRDAPVATGNIVEDMQLGLDFAAAGRAPMYVPGAAVHSEFPSGEQASAQQRTRWEHGHLATITSAWRQWGWQALKGRTPGLLHMLLDLSVPPLALMVLLQTALLMAAAALTALMPTQPWAWAALTLLGSGLLATGISVIWAWRGFGRHLLSGHEMLAMPAYALRKIPMYLAYVVKRQTAWVRTERDAKKGNS